MGFDLKYGVITTERGEIPRDEPVFLIRAKDATAPRAIREYADGAEEAGADPELVEIVRSRAVEIETWQLEHPDLVKVPDNAPGQIVADGAAGYSNAELKGGGS